ncbi:MULTISPECIES: carboxymuconolactone decarboxylase family protein [Asaia]|uniref:Cytochrome D ubiquinol oxidase subunit II n=2 Tax=Asaia TaxID=91914 RepID=A0ABQ1LLF5_9PROT|nr:MULTISPECIES: carboxymuconolactone decarboxylase family protein [Asaia]GBR05276.1 putative gamma-carboxymuconolactone decarboxylase subunit [Asaia siamensis NRIC 0323]GBR17007.1 putative gamma-carboxymuconolactone decarboxylase subunit [Asaia spathodeae NBRC 105894]GGC26203.1 cytochrome D ubiquinol oxidase subunit II [Asaia siamensis]
MAGKNDTAQKAFGDVAPDLARYTDQVLFDEVWARPGLTPRERCMVTVTCLIALYRGNELGFHLRKALDTGVTQDEIIEIITHLAFYSGWPTASSALAIARQVFTDSRES